MRDERCLEVTAGDYPCAIQSSNLNANPQTITCNVNSLAADLDPIPVNNHYEVNVKQGTYGYCLVAQDSETNRHFYMKASTTGVAPRIGSISGGTTITIEGEGYVDGETTVSIAGFGCIVSEVTYTTVVCTTEARVGASDGTVEVNYKIIVNIVFQ